MPVNVPEFGAERGQAGETGFTRSKKYNFANLYAMNRGDEALKDKADQFQKGAASVNSQMSDQVKKAQNQAGGIAGTAPVSQNQMNYAMNQAKDISNQAQNFSVENEAMKQGQSPYQSAISGFYSGVSNPYINQIRSFSNLYNTALGKQQQIQGLLAPKPGTGQAIDPKKPKPKVETGYGRFMSQQEADLRTQQRNAGNRGDKMTSHGTLDWALETGRITGDEYYAAQGGPGTPGYEKIKGKLQ